jgi:hypothetical protein
MTRKESNMLCFVFVVLPCIGLFIAWIYAQ